MRERERERVNEREGEIERERISGREEVRVKKNIIQGFWYEKYFLIVDFLQYFQKQDMFSVANMNAVCRL